MGMEAMGGMGLTVLTATTTTPTSRDTMVMATTGTGTGTTRRRMRVTAVPVWEQPAVPAACCPSAFADQPNLFAVFLDDYYIGGVGVSPPALELFSQHISGKTPE